MLKPNQQNIYSFTCGACGSKTRVNFDKSINVDTLKYIPKKKKTRQITEKQKLVKLRNQT